MVISLPAFMDVAEVGFLVSSALPFSACWPSGLARLTSSFFFPVRRPIPTPWSFRSVSSPSPPAAELPVRRLHVDQGLAALFENSLLGNVERVGNSLDLDSTSARRPGLSSKAISYILVRRKGQLRIVAVLVGIVGHRRRRGWLTPATAGAAGSALTAAATARHVAAPRHRPDRGLDRRGRAPAAASAHPFAPEACRGPRPSR